MRTAVLLLVVLAGTAAAAPAKKLPAADQKKLSTALRTGRELQHKKKYTEAIAAFEQGLAVVPDDATLLSELGWTAYLAKDLDKAEAATKKALVAQAAPNIRAATLYNFGLIAEAKGDKAAAADSYLESLRLRSNATVRKALAKLDPNKAAAFDPFKSGGMPGPFESIAAFCKTKPAKETQGDLTIGCTCGTQLEARKPKLSKPFEQVQMFKRQCIEPDPTNANGGFGVDEYFVAAKIASGWYVDKVDERDCNRHCATGVTYRGATIEGHTPVLALLRYSFEGDCHGGILSNEWEGERIIAIGVGPSGVPSATPPLRTRAE